MGLGHILSNTLLLTYFQEGPTNNTIYVIEGKDKLQAELWKGTKFSNGFAPGEIVMQNRAARYLRRSRLTISVPQYHPFPVL